MIYRYTRGWALEAQKTKLQDRAEEVGDGHNGDILFSLLSSLTWERVVILLVPSESPWNSSQNCIRWGEKKDKDLYTEDVIYPSLRNFPQYVNSLAVQLCLHKNWGLDELCYGEGPGLESCIPYSGFGVCVSSHLTVYHGNQMWVNEI